MSHSPPQKHPKLTLPTLSNDINLYIISFLSIPTLMQVTASLPASLRMLLRECILSGYFFRIREKRCFVEFLWDKDAAKNVQRRDEQSAAQHAVQHKAKHTLASVDWVKLNRGFPQTYHDLQTLDDEVRKMRIGPRTAEIPFYEFWETEKVDKFGEDWVYSFHSFSSLAHSIDALVKSADPDTLYETMQYLPPVLTDKTFLCKLVRRNVEFYDDAPENLKNDAELVMSMLLAFGDYEDKARERIPPRFESDTDFFRDACQEAPVAFAFAPESLKSDPEFVRQLLVKWKKTSVLKFATEKLRNDGKFIISLQPEKYKNGWKDILDMVRTGPLIRDTEFLLHAIQFEAQFVHHLPKDLVFSEQQLITLLNEHDVQWSELPLPNRENRAVVLAAINQELWMNIDALGGLVGNDKEYVMAILKGCREGYDPDIYVHRNQRLTLGETLSKDGEFIEQLIQEDVVHIVDESLALHHQHDRNLWKEIVQHGGSGFQLTPFKEDRELILEALKNPRCAKRTFSRLDKKLQRDKEIIRVALPVVGSDVWRAAVQIGFDFSKNRELLLRTIGQHPDLLAEQPANVQRDPEFLFAVLPRSFELERIMSLLHCNDKETALKIVHLRPQAFEFLGEKWRSDREVALEAVKGSGFNLQHIDDKDLKTDKEVAANALFEEGEVLTELALALCSEDDVDGLRYRLRKGVEFSYQDEERALLQEMEDDDYEYEELAMEAYMNGDLDW